MEITSLQKNDFEKFFQLMQLSFPPQEYRIKEKQYAILENPNYSVKIYKENEKINAFIAAWSVYDFTFIEHLAVSPDLRNRGIGSQFVSKYLSQSDHPVVLEVENKDDEISKRRIRFYQRLGFILSDICYNQPNFDGSETVIPLRIMYYPKNFPFDIESVKRKIFEKVYKTFDGEKI